MTKYHWLAKLLQTYIRAQYCHLENTTNVYFSIISMQGLCLTRISKITIRISSKEF